MIETKIVVDQVKEVSPQRVDVKKLRDGDFFYKTYSDNVPPVLCIKIDHSLYKHVDGVGLICISNLYVDRTFKPSVVKITWQT